MNCSAVFHQLLVARVWLRERFIANLLGDFSRLATLGRTSFGHRNARRLLQMHSSFSLLSQEKVKGEAAKL